MTHSTHKDLACFVTQGVVDGAAIRFVYFDEEPVFDGDSGFRCFHAEPVQPDELVLVCLGCLIDRHVEAGRGMDLARAGGGHGSAWWDGEEWRTGAGA